MEIYTTLDKHCPAGNCQVDLGELVKGDWTQAIFVKRMTPISVLSERVETEELKIGEFDDVIIFANGREVERVEKRTYRPEQPFNGTIFLDYPDGSGPLVYYARNEARFAMRITEGEGWRNIYLVGH